MITPPSFRGLIFLLATALASSNHSSSNDSRTCRGAGAGGNLAASPVLQAQSAFESMLDGVAVFPGSLPRRCIVGTFEEDWARITGFIQDGYNFAIVRYNDGERMIINEEEISKATQAFEMDRFWFDGGESELGKDLAWSLTGHFGEAFFYGLPNPERERQGLAWYLEHTEQHCAFITSCNIFIHANYDKTKSLLEHVIASQLHRIVLVANHESVDKFLSTLDESLRRGVPHLKLPDNAPYTYTGQHRLELIRNATLLARSHTGSLFLVSGGPMAKPLISHMWTANPLNQYVDFGSSMDEIFKGRSTRPYTDPNSADAQYSDPAWTLTSSGEPVVLTMH